MDVVCGNGFPACSIHGDKSHREREDALRQFKTGRCPVLVATDVAARGLDIPGVELVVNMDMAYSGDEYLHRIGRTGRADNEGRAVSLVDAKEWNLTKSIERYLGVSFEVISIPGLKGHYQGPDKTKSSGKSVGTKKKTTVKDKKADAKPKVKVRERDKKNIGNRRVPKAVAAAPVMDGFAPPKKKVEKQIEERDE